MLLLLELACASLRLSVLTSRISGEQGRHRVLKLKGKGQTTKAAVAHAVDRAKGVRTKGPLLITSTGERLTRQHAGKLIKRMGEQIGIPDLHPHALSHGFVTLSLDEEYRCGMCRTPRGMPTPARHGVMTRTETASTATPPTGYSARSSRSRHPRTSY